MVAPAALMASATSIIWLCDSTEQGPAITTSCLPPMEIPLTGTSLGWDLVSRLPHSPPPPADLLHVGFRDSRLHDDDHGFSPREAGGCSSRSDLLASTPDAPPPPPPGPPP